MFIDIALKSVWRRRLRATLTILGVAASLQLYLSLNRLTALFEEDVQKQFGAFAGKLFVQQAMPESSVGWQTFPPLGSSITAEKASALLAMDAVEGSGSAAVLFVQLVAPIIPMNPPEVLVVGIVPGSEAAFLGGIGAESGTSVLPDDRSVILGRGAAGHFRSTDSEPASVGQSIEVQGESFTVAGVLEEAPRVFQGAVLMSLPRAQELFNRKGTVSTVILTASGIGKADALQAAVRTRHPDLDPSGQEELLAGAHKMLALVGTFFAMMDKTTLAVVAIIVAIVMVVAVLEQRHDIGTLRAIGARRRDIIVLVMSESIGLSVVGAVASLPLSAVAGWVFWHWGISTDILLVWIRAVGISVALGALASLLPAWQAARVDPLEALRYE